MDWWPLGVKVKSSLLWRLVEVRKRGLSWVRIWYYEFFIAGWAQWLHFSRRHRKNGWLIFTFISGGLDKYIAVFLAEANIKPRSLTCSGKCCNHTSLLKVGNWHYFFPHFWMKMTQMDMLCTEFSDLFCTGGCECSQQFSFFRRCRNLKFAYL